MYPRFSFNQGWKDTQLFPYNCHENKKEVFIFIAPRSRRHTYPATQGHTELHQSESGDMGGRRKRGQDVPIVVSKGKMHEVGK